jgi:hypothetical protein
MLAQPIHDPNQTNPDLTALLLRQVHHPELQLETSDQIAQLITHLVLVSRENS